MIQLAIFLVVVLVGALLFVKFRKSKKIDNFAYDLTHEEASPPIETGKLIGEAQKADEALVQRAEENVQAIETLQSETQVIEDYREPATPVSTDEVKAEAAETEEDKNAIE